MAERDKIGSPNKKSSFAGDVLKLASGATLAQALSILIAPVLAWFYAPEAFGTLAVFLSITSTVGVVACLRYELSIMLPGQDEDAANLLALSLFFVVVVSIITAVVTLLARNPIVSLLNAPDLASYLLLVPLDVLARGAFLALNYWNSRTKHFGRLSIAQVAQSLAKNGSQVGLGIIGQNHAGGLIWSGVLGTGVVTGVLGGQIWRDDHTLLCRSTSWRGMLSGLKRHYKFPLYGVWTALLNTLSWQLPAMMLSAFFSPAIVGFYAFGNRLVRMPLSLIGGSIAQVFFQRSAEANVEGNLSIVVESAFKRLVSLGLFPALLLTFIGRDIFVAFFGERWADAGVYSQILSVYMFFNFIAAPLGQLFSVLERQEIALFTNVALFTSRFGALWFGGQMGDIMLTLYLFSVSGVLVYGGYSLWLLANAGVPLKVWFVTVGRGLLSSATILAVCWLISFSFDLHLWSLLVIYALGTFVYYGWVLISDEQLLRLSRQLVGRYL
jgi:O-antigen/teichoic acid export membrane protein